MFDWSAYLELARTLGQDPSEQHGRTAISRAYYAAFHHAKFLKRLRTWADYQSGSKVDLPREVEKAISHAQRIMQDLQ